MPMQIYRGIAALGPHFRGLVEGCKQSASRTRDLVLESTRDLSEKGCAFINRLTGYDECNKLRLEVTQADALYKRLQQELRTTRDRFEEAVRARHGCQKELNALLQRKPSWQDSDLLRFTELYRQEMRLEQAEVEAKNANDSAEKQVDEAHQSLMDTLRERYQQEQLWSDKIRRLSTFGTFSLVGLNVLLFLLVQFYAEPRKRRRFAQSLEQMIETKSEEMLQRISASTLEQVARIKPPGPAAGHQLSKSGPYAENLRGAIVTAGIAAAGLLATQVVLRSLGLL